MVTVLDREFFLSEIVGRRIYLKSNSIGKLKDLVIQENAGKIPEVTHLLVHRPYGDSQNKIKFTQGELRKNALTSSMKFLETTINEFKNDETIPITQAARVALQLEKGLWEKKVFQFFEGDSDEVRRVLDSLNSEQGLHIIQIDNFGLQFMGKSAV